MSFDGCGGINDLLWRFLVKRVTGCSRFRTGTAMVGKNGHFGKVIAGKFNHLEGNFDFLDKEIHKK